MKLNVKCFSSHWNIFVYLIIYFLVYLAPFFTVETTTGHRLSLSYIHYIRVKHFGYLPAVELTLNHSLYVVDTVTGTIRETRIRSIKIEDKDGAFNPLTISGTLLVNGIFASSYVRIFRFSHETWHRIVMPFRWWHYVAKYLGIYPAYSVDENDIHWCIKGVISLIRKRQSIYSIFKVICVIVMFHLLYGIYNLIMRKRN
jgi:hypothetical protein